MKTKDAGDSCLHSEKRVGHTRLASEDKRKFLVGKKSQGEYQSNGETGG